MSQLPTDAALTAQGAILGTLQYISPEQVEGQEADSRSDIFCFGATLYEMVTGAKAFEGKSQVSLMAAILEHEPRPISSLQPVSPPLLERVLRKCFAKDPNSRWQSASDLMEALEWVRGGVGAPSTAVPVEGRGLKARDYMLGTIAVVAVIAIAAAIMFLRKPNDSPMWVSVIPPANNFSAEPVLAVAPDGKRIVFGAPNATGANSLWLRSIDASDARELPGTSDGILPFWSPDGKSIGFFNFAEGKLKRLDISGGTPQVLAPAANPRGGSWGTDGTILFVPAPTSEVQRIPASGGTAVPLKKEQSVSQTFEQPHFLPDGKHFLFFIFDADLQKQGLYAASLDGGEPKRIMGGISKGEYANGYLFFCKGPDLFAQPFDPGKLEAHGEEKRIASGIGYYYGDTSNRAFSVGAGGALAFSAQSALATSQLTWVDRSGKQLDRIGDAGNYFGIAASPDHKKVVLERSELTGEIGIWLVEFTNGIASKLTTAYATPVWAPDGERVFYAATDGSIQSINISSGKKNNFFPASDGLGVYLQTTSADGRYLLWTKSTDGQSDPWIAPLDGSQKPTRFLQTPYNEFRTEISPDGHWIAYVTNESGTDEVMVESFPQPGQRKRISPEGGAFPEWQQDGKVLYYLAPGAGQRRKLMAVKVEASASSFSASRPEFLFETPQLITNPRRGQYVPFDNGARFLMNAIVQETKPRVITLVLNWPSLLK
jgi:Tol biopolymer transport system component